MGTEENPGISGATSEKPDPIEQQMLEMLAKEESYRDAISVLRSAMEQAGIAHEELVNHPDCALYPTARTLFHLSQKLTTELYVTREREKALRRQLGRAELKLRNQEIKGAMVRDMIQGENINFRRHCL